MIESFIYLIVRQDHPGVQKKTGSRQHRGWGAERGDSLRLSSNMVFLFIISAKFFSLSHNDCLSLVSIAIAWKELPTGHTSHPTQTRFSRKAPMPTSDDLTIHFNHQSGAGSPAVNHDVTAWLRMSFWQGAIGKMKQLGRETVYWNANESFVPVL